MTYEKIIKQAFILLQEDPLYPNFWDASLVAGEESEMMMYAYEGLREILNKTEINVTESTIPLYAQLQQEFDENGDPVLDPETGDPVFSKKNFLGYYNIPINRIQKIQKVNWKPKPTYVENVPEGEEPYWKVGAYSELKVVDPDYMDIYDPQWRDRRTSGTPTHAVLFSGNYDDMRMSNAPNLLRNNLKIKIYPTPTDIDENLQELLGSLSGLQTELDARRMSFNGGLMNDAGGDLVWGIDEDGDGERDDIVLPGSTNLGILVQLLNGEVDLSRFGNFPIIRYVPDFEDNIFTTITTVDEEVIVDWFDLDLLIPKTLQLALRDYICHRAFDKEGEAIDDKKALKYLNKFEEKVSEYRAMNMVMRREIKTSDSNFNMGYHTNKDELMSGYNRGSYGYGNGYGNGFY